MQIIHIKNLKMVSEDEVAKYSIPLEHLWLVNHNDEIFGPFNENDVKACFFSNPEEHQNTLICNMQDGQWIPVFKHKTFQRRKPQLAAAVSPDAEQFEIENESQIYIFKMGQKFGPFNYLELNSKIDDKSILMTDLLSIDQGKTWQKVYQYPKLNRREVLNVDHLPNSNIKIDIKTPLQIIKNDIDQDMAGLAFIHRVNHSQAFEIDPIAFGKEKQKTIQKLKNKRTLAGIAASACIIVILATSLTSNKNNKLNNRTIASDQEQQEIVKDENENETVEKARNTQNQNQIRRNNKNAIKNIQNKRNSIVVNKNITNTRLPRARRNVSPIRGATQDGIRPNNSTNHTIDSVDNYADSNDDRLKDPREEFDSQNNKNKPGRAIAQNPYKDERDAAQEAIDQIDSELQSENNLDQSSSEYREQNDF
jgi:hypothetical protein